MAEDNSISFNELNALQNDAIPSTVDVATDEDIPLLSVTLRDTENDDWVIVEATEAIEENIIDGLNVTQVQEEQFLEPRGGPQVRDYLAEFFIYLNRLGLRLNYFCAPMELQRTMEQMESARVPVSMWRAFINASINLLSRIGIEFNTNTLLDTLIFVLAIVSEFFIHNMILKIVALIIGCLGPELLGKIIMCIYEFIKRFVKIFWKYVKNKLRDYCELSTQMFKEYMRPKND